jgi:hypothetical protein
MSHSCVQWRGDIGAYIVDALDGPDRDRVARHLASCAGCLADYDELVPVRDRLALLTVTVGGRAPGPSRPPARLAELPAVRPGPRRWLVAAGATLATAAAAVAVLMGSGAPAHTFRAADGATGVSGSAQLHATPTGTQIDLTARGLPRSEQCILIAVTRGGSDIAGSWAAAYDGSARIAGTTAIQAGQLTALRIESDTGVLLLSIRV